MGDLEDLSNPVPFGKVRLFNERSTGGAVRVRLCTSAGTATVPPAAAADSGVLGLPAAPGGAAATPRIVWGPAGGLTNVLRVLVDTWDADGTYRYTFGLYGVGLAGGAAIQGVTVTLSGTDGAGSQVDVAISRITGETWTVIRTATQTQASPPASGGRVTCTVNGSPSMKIGSTTPTDGNGIIQGASTTDKTDQWVRAALAASAVAPVLNQFTTVLPVDVVGGDNMMLGRWLSDGTQEAAEAATGSGQASSESNQMVVIGYSDGGSQIVDYFTGLALTSPSSAEAALLLFVPPDATSTVTGTTYGQFWNGSAF